MGDILEKAKQGNPYGGRKLTSEEQKHSFNGGSLNIDLLLPLLTAVFSNNKTNPSLDEKVAYLNGKVDTLEKYILNNK